MGKNNNVIHINGKRYDATTGAALSIDGVIAPSGQRSQPVALAKPAPIPIVTTKPSMNDVVRSPVKHVKKHPVQTSQTLMRHAVSKPSTAKRIKSHSHAGALSKQPSVVLPKQSATTLDHRRINHAAKVPQHQFVQKFAPLGASDPALLTTSQPTASVKPLQHTPHAKRPRTTADVLQAALEQANSHEQTYTAPSRFTNSRRLVSIIMASSALLLIVIFAGLHSVTAVKLHMASSKAGFAVAVPDYQPAGFSLGNLSYNPGNSNLQYKSNSDDRAFSIVEKTSQWDSNTLRDMVVAPGNKSYQTIESAGRTIFVDNQHTANWVNAGVWYQVKNPNALSDHQLVQIANSL